MTPPSAPPFTLFPAHPRPHLPLGVAHEKLHAAFAVLETQWEALACTRFASFLRGSPRPEERDTEGSGFPARMDNGEPPFPTFLFMSNDGKTVFGIIAPCRSRSPPFRDPGPISVQEDFISVVLKVPRGQT